MLMALQGAAVEVTSHEEIKPADEYVTKCDNGWRILTCKTNNKFAGYIVPIEQDATVKGDHFAAVDDCYKILRYLPHDLSCRQAGYKT